MELRAAFADRFPDADPASLVNAVRSWVPLAQLPPRGVWGAGGQPVYGLLEDWLGEPLSAPDPEDLVRRYLAAYGPASPADMQKWSGLTGLREVFKRMDLAGVPDRGRPRPVRPAGRAAGRRRPAGRRPVSSPTSTTSCCRTRTGPVSSPRRTAPG